MQQNNHHIENNLAKIEREAEGDLSQMDNHWASMKYVLALQKPTMTTAKKWLWASLPITVIIVLVLLIANKFSSKTNIAIEENKSAVDVKKVLPDSTSIQKNTIAINQYKLINTNSITQTNKNNQIPNNSFPKKMSPALLIPKTGNTGKSNIINDANAIDTTSASKLTIADSIKINNELERIQKVQMLNDFIAKIKKKGELFTINNLRDTTIRAAEGTVFYIPMNCFDTKDSVVFEVKEYYKYSDMVANGLTTMADDKLLISGGMLSLTATVKGNEVALNPTKEIRVFIPNITAKDSMKIFNGIKKTSERRDFTDNNFLNKDNNINWQLTDRNFLSPNRAMYVRAIDLRDDNVKERNVFFTNKRVGVFFKSTKSKISKEALLLKLRKKYGTYYDIIKVKNIWKRNLLFQKRDLKGDLLFVGNDTRGIGDTILCKPEELRYFNFEIIDTIYFANNFGAANLMSFATTNFSPKVLKMIDNKYSIGINTLGWINCDRFYNYGGEKQDIYVNINDNANNYITYLIFENYKSIMNGYWANKEFKFPNVPLGIPAKILSIGVKNGQTVFAMKSIITSKNIVSDLQFEQTSSLEFKETLKTLDKPLNE